MAVSLQDFSVMHFIDNHLHLQDIRLISVVDSVIQEAIELQFKLFVVNGTSEADWVNVINISQTYSQIIPCIGLHPWYVGQRSADWLRVLSELSQKYNTGMYPSVKPHVFKTISS